MPIHIELQAIYSSFLAQSPGGTHQATAFMEFIAQICNASAAGAEAVIEAKLLDVILALYINAFVPDVPTYRSSFLFLACNKTLSHLASHPILLERLRAHPIHHLWPRWAELPLTHTVLRQVQDRQSAWRSLYLADPGLVEQRLAKVREILKTSMPPRNIKDIRDIWRDFPSTELTATTTDVFDDFVDLLEFLR